MEIERGRLCGADDDASVVDATKEFERDDHDGSRHSQLQSSMSPHEHHLHFSAIDVSTNKAVSIPSLQNYEESTSLNSSKGSKTLSERRLPSKKRKMSYESCDSATADSYLGLASLDSGIIPKLHQGSVDPFECSLPVVSGVSALDHLNALGDEGLPMPAPAMGPIPSNTRPPEASSRDIGTTWVGKETAAEDNNSGSNATFTSSGHRLLLEAILMTEVGSTGGVGGRNRLESWGGMSDLSVGPDKQNTAAAIAASALHHTGIIDDVVAAANLRGGSVASSVTDDHQQATAEGGIFGREHKESVTSLSDSTFPVPSSLDDLELSSDLQKFVAAAVAQVGDQLAELAGNIESAVAAVDIDSTTVSKADNETRHESSEVTSSATRISSGAFVDKPSRIDAISGRRRAAQQLANSTFTHQNAGIAVDYDAVAAAVDAARTATGRLDLEAIGDSYAAISSPASAVLSTNGTVFKPKCRRKSTTTREKCANQHHMIFSDKGDPVLQVSKACLPGREQEEIRERARKAAGYVRPSRLAAGTPGARTATHAKTRARSPLKKRIKRIAPQQATPIEAILNTKIQTSTTSTDLPPQDWSSVPAFDSKPKKKESSVGSAKVKEKSTEKWDLMLQCLLAFKAERKEEETKGSSEEETAEWVWDGNVPTTYKTNDGKALGRWVNNQRSAKSKGTLREEREELLVDAGLKWSVLASNSWDVMLEELKVFKAQHGGDKWDGNVPTNYRIKAKSKGKRLAEEDRNLGRWVNRQRSLFHAGKLRGDRRCALEKIGLKWSMLATTSWSTMFEALQKVALATASWNGSIPANYKTDDNLALGRWINRQRSLFHAGKLRQDRKDALEKVGLKWSVHERRSESVGITAGNPPIAPPVPSTVAVPLMGGDGSGCKAENASSFDETEKSNVSIQKEGQMRNEQI